MTRMRLPRERLSFNRSWQTDDYTKYLLEGGGATVTEGRLGVTVDALQFPVHDNGK